MAIVVGVVVSIAATIPFAAVIGDVTASGVAGLVVGSLATGLVAGARTWRHWVSAVLLTFLGLWAAGMLIMVLGAASAPRWSSQTEANFTRGCESGAPPEGKTQAYVVAYCGCTLRGLEAVYSETEFSTFEDDVRAGKPIPDKFSKAGVECLVNSSAY